MTGVPARIAWAVELLDLRGDERVLEFGCGPGVAAAMVADRLTEGRLMAIDRSATAIARATARNAGHLATGRLVLERVSLREFRTGERFDKAFGVNVNLFWTTDAGAECRTLRELLVPAGVVHLVYDRPGVVDQVVATLTQCGFEAAVRLSGDRALACVTGGSVR